MLEKGVHLRWDLRNEATQSFEGKRSLKGRGKIKKKRGFRLGVMVHPLHPSAREAEACGPLRARPARAAETLPSLNKLFYSSLLITFYKLYCIGLFLFCFT